MSIVKYWAAMQLDTWNHLSRTNLFKGKIVRISFFVTVSLTPTNKTVRCILYTRVCVPVRQVVFARF